MHPENDDPILTFTARCAPIRPGRATYTIYAACRTADGVRWPLVKDVSARGFEAAVQAAIDSGRIDKAGDYVVRNQSSDGGVTIITVRPVNAFQIAGRA